MPERVAILLDGGFVKKKLRGRLKRFPKPQDVIDLCVDIMRHPRLDGAKLFRVYYYDAPPLEGSATNPLDGTTIDFSATLPARGLKVYLELMGHGVRRELKAHADLVL